MRFVYDVIRIPFGDRRALAMGLFKPSVIATCKSRQWAQHVVGLQNNSHAYEIMERRVGR